MTGRGIGLALPLVLALLAGCDPSGDAPAPASEPELSTARSWISERSWGEGGPVVYTVCLSALELSLADDLWVQEELQVAEGYTAEFPDILPGDLDGLGLVRVVDEEPEPGAPRRRQLQLAPERTGEVALAERWVFFRQPEQLVEPEGSLRSSRIPLSVEPLPAELDLSLPEGPTIFTADPAPPASARWPWALALLGALVVAWAARRRLRSERPPPPPRPPHEVAHEALRKLDALGLLAEGDLEGYFVYLSAILRDYVEARFGLHAPERTTQEFLREAEQSGDLATHRDLLRAFLRQADAIKFARETLELDEARRARGTVAEFVDSTSRSTPVPAGALA